MDAAAETEQRRLQDAGSSGQIPQLSQLSIEYRRVDEVNHLPGNPKEHNLESIIDSITQYGFIVPLGLDASDSTDFDGNGRLDALTKMQADEMAPPKGILVDSDGTWMVPTVKGIDWLDKDQRMAAAIALNRTNELGWWNMGLLTDALQHLEKKDMLAGTGFSEEELEALLAQVRESGGSSSGESQESDGDGGEGSAGESGESAATRKADELQEKWKVKPGDLYQLGEHRIICGTCEEPGILARLMGEEKADLLLTDPPYNLAEHNEIYAKNIREGYENLKGAEWDKQFDPLPFLNSVLSFLAEDCALYVFTGHRLFGTIIDWMEEKIGKSSFCVWCKPNPMPSLAKVTWAFGTELVCYCRRGKPVFNYPEEGHALNWWPINRGRAETEHPAEKESAVIEHILQHHSAEGAIVLDCFSGSGTTLMVSEKLDRKARMVEKDPKWVSVTLERYFVETGRMPELIL